MWLGSCGRNLIMSARKLILLRKSLKKDNNLVTIVAGQNYIFFFNPILRLNSNLACCYMKAWDFRLLAAFPPHLTIGTSVTKLLEVLPTRYYRFLRQTFHCLPNTLKLEEYLLSLLAKLVIFNVLTSVLTIRPKTKKITVTKAITNTNLNGDWRDIEELLISFIFPPGDKPKINQSLNKK